MRKNTIKDMYKLLYNVPTKYLLHIISIIEYILIKRDYYLYNDYITTYDIIDTRVIEVLDNV